MTELLLKLYRESSAIRKGWTTGTIIFELDDVSYLLSGKNLIRMVK